MIIKVDPHTLARADERGATLTEINETINSGHSIKGKKGRLAKSEVFPFFEYRNGRYYEEKKLEVYYVIEENTIITVTVYVFYGSHFSIT